MPPEDVRPPRRRRLLPGGRGRQGHGDVLGHRERRGAGLRLLAGRRVRQRRLGRLRPQGDGHHRPRRVGLGAAALPRARDRLPDRGVHRGRHRRHERRRVRQRAAVLRAPPGWSRRSTTATSSSTPTPDAGDVVRRAPAALRPAALELAGLRQEPDLRGRRCLPALAQVGPAQRRGPRGPGHRRVGAGDDPGRADEGDPPGAGRPAVERRHRHLRQGRGRDPRRRRRQGQRRDPDQRLRAARPVRGGGRQPRAHPGRPHRVRPERWRRRRRQRGGRPDQHRLHRQLRRRRHVRPRGQHQDPARPGGQGRRPHRQAAQRPARGDDRRGGRARAARQLRAEPRHRERRRPRAVPAARARGLHAPPRAGRAPSTARSRGCRPGGRYAAGSTAVAG